MKETPSQYRVRGTPVPTTRTRGTNYPKSTPQSKKPIHNGNCNIAKAIAQAKFRYPDASLAEVTQAELSLPLPNNRSLKLSERAEDAQHEVVSGVLPTRRKGQSFFDEVHARTLLSDLVAPLLPRRRL